MDKSRFICAGPAQDLFCDLELPKDIGMDTIFYNRDNIKQDIYKEVSNIEDFMKIL